MARLIDADELKKAVEDFPNCYNGWSDTYDKAFIIGAIEEAPTIDAVSVVHGEWIEQHENGHGLWVGVCSRCGEENLVDNYCPNCGAKMREREGE